MRVLPVFAVAALFVLPGCELIQETLSDTDGVSCAHSEGARAVYIDIVSYEAGPKGDCTVDPGTRITWRGPPGEMRSFEIAFTGGVSPGGRGTPRDYPSHDTGGRQRASLVANGTPGTTYPYEIRVDGQAIDPAIIIR
ncbi:MAG: hypothetical protein LOX98_09295 [Lysobacter sp.]|nr:hypothetical protein [Lysobacter sp.]MDV5981601.1 hypothetical protein [Lysobacter sp.]